jgi:hexosaminidase
MKKLLFLFLIFAVTRTFGQSQEINLIPKPVEMHRMEGTCELSSSSTIGYNNKEAAATAEMLAAKINTATGYSLKADQDKSATIQFNLNRKPDEQLGKEGYTLTSDPKGVTITANETAGLFYGMQTLLQLMPDQIESPSPVNVKWTIPAVSIIDYPRFGWRGLMLDVSRNFFTKEEVEQYIDQMSRYKFNTFHWHLTDDNGWRVEIKALPRLTEVGAWRVHRVGHFGDRAAPKPGEPATDGGFYTQDDIREVIQYAKERHVTIIPEIDVPGHSMAAIASYPELSCSKDTSTKVNPGSSFSEWFNDGTFKMKIDNTLNPSDENVYAFLDKVFTELAALFPNQYIHVGGDECYKGFWMKDPGCQALMKKENMKTPEELQSYFMKRVENILKSKGKKLIGWDEILEGGLAPEATVMSWRGIKGGIEAAKMGHDVVMTPTTYAYLDYQQGERTIEPPMYSSLRMEKCYSFNPVPEGVDAKYILGGQGNLWTEQVPIFRHVEYMTWPRGWALAEDFWTPDNEKNWPDFVSRVEDNFKRLDIAGINHAYSIYDAIINVKNADGKKIIEMGSEVPGLDIYYTFDNTMPDNNSPKYVEPFVLPEGPVSLRVITYRNGKPIGHLITRNPQQLRSR